MSNGQKLYWCNWSGKYFLSYQIAIFSNIAILIFFVLFMVLFLYSFLDVTKMLRAITLAVTKMEEQWFFSLTKLEEQQLHADQIAIAMFKEIIILNFGCTNIIFLNSTKKIKRFKTVEIKIENNSCVNLIQRPKY